MKKLSEIIKDKINAADDRYYVDVAREAGIDVDEIAATETIAAVAIIIKSVEEWENQ